MPLDIKQLIDSAFRRAKKRAGSYTCKDKFKEFKTRALLKIGTVYQIVTSKLESYVRSFPWIEGELKKIVESKFSMDEIRRSFAVVLWAARKIRELWILYAKLIRKEKKSRKKIRQYVKAFYGRVADILEYIRDRVEYLNELEKFLSKIPDIQSKYARLVILGPPNAGKTTLLVNLTGRSAKVAPYAFTTKELQEGVVSDEFGFKVSLIDTPGILKTEEDKMNEVERLAKVASEVYSNFVIFIFDPTESVMTLEQQLELFRRTVLEQKKDCLVIISKKDLVDSKKIEEFEKRIREIWSGEIIVANLMDKNDINKIKEKLFTILFKIPTDLK